MTRELKKTLRLFIMAIGLGVVAYYTIELPMQRSWQEEKRASALYDQEKLGELRSIKLPETTLELVDGVWRVEGRPVAKDKIAELLGLLSELQVVRRLDDAGPDLWKLVIREESQVKFEFHFEHGNLQFSLGQKSPVNDSFYLALTNGQNKQLLLVRDGTLDTRAMPEEMHRLNPMKYGRLRSLLLRARDYFDENFLIAAAIKTADLKKITFNTFRNRSFWIDWNSGQTQPAPFHPIKTSQEAFISYRNQIKELRAEHVYRPIRRELLKKSLGEIYVELQDGKKIEFSLYQNYGSLKGIFCVPKNEDLLFEFSYRHVPILMPSLQQFWDKRPLPVAKNEQMATIKSENFNIQFKQTPVFQLRIPLIDEFKVEGLSGGGSPIHQSFAHLFALMLSPAESVSLLDIDEKKNLQDMVSSGASGLELTYRGKKIRVMESMGQLKVINKDDGLIYHYPAGAQDHKIGLVAQDYFLF